MRLKPRRAMQPRIFVSELLRIRMWVVARSNGPGRGATNEFTPAIHQIVNRRYATQDPRPEHFRGLKPTATIMRSLCDQSQNA